MLGMQEEQKDPYLDVLKEIKQLMDARLGDKLKGGVPAEGVEASPAEGSPQEESLESPEQEKSEGDDMGMSPEEKDKLKQMYSSI